MTADQIKSLRLSLYRTQAAFAKIIGVTPVTVSRWEAGTRPLPVFIEKMEKLKKFSIKQEEGR